MQEASIVTYWQSAWFASGLFWRFGSFGVAEIARGYMYRLPVCWAVIIVLLQWLAWHNSAAVIDFLTLRLCLMDDVHALPACRRFESGNTITIFSTDCHKLHRVRSICPGQIHPSYTCYPDLQIRNWWYVDHTDSLDRSWPPKRWDWETCQPTRSVGPSPRQVHIRSAKLS